MNKLQIKGTQEFLGVNIPVIHGGFGENQKVMLAKTISEVHGVELRKINELINNHIEYYVYVSGKFYIPIPKADSIDTTAKKIAGIIRPTVKRGDVDNYIKLILDVLHDVVYDDDKNVIGITAEKYYSTEPRIELNIKIEYKETRNE